MLGIADELQLSDNDLRELFALFSSVTEEEVAQIYSPQNRLFFQNEDISKEYSLTQEKKEFAIDAWRAVMYFLHRHGYTVTKSGEGGPLVR